MYFTHYNRRQGASGVPVSPPLIKFPKLLPKIWIKRKTYGSTNRQCKLPPLTVVALTVPGSNIIKVKYCEHCLPGLWFVKGEGASGEKLAQAQERGLGSRMGFSITSLCDFGQVTSLLWASQVLPPSPAFP